MKKDTNDGAVVIGRIFSRCFSKKKKEKQQEKFPPSSKTTEFVDWHFKIFLI